MTGQTAPRWMATMADQRFPEFPWNQLAPLWATVREQAMRRSTFRWERRWTRRRAR